MRLSRIASSKTVPTTFSCQRHLVIQVSVLFRKIMQRKIILGKHFEEWSAVRWRFIKLRQRSKNWAWLILHGLTCWSSEPCISVGHLTNRAVPLSELPERAKIFAMFFQIFATWAFSNEISFAIFATYALLRTRRYAICHAIARMVGC